MNEDLIVPIYIDTNALLDLLASIEGGFSVIEKVTTQSTHAKSIDREVKGEAGTEFGIPNVLSLLKLNLGYTANWQKSNEGSEQRETERYHTYGSLLYRLREYLYAKSLVKRFVEEETGWAQIRPSDFVEIRGVFRPNPLANSLEIIDRLIGIVQLLSVETLGQQSLTQPKTSPEDKKRNQEQKRRLQQQTKQIEEIRKFIRGILSDLQGERVRVFVVDLGENKSCKAVAILFLDYLRDQTMTELSYKEYRLLGKVVRKIEKDTDESVDLLLGTGLGGIGKETIEGLVGQFSDMPEMNLPTVETKILGPALEIVPIAIFV